MNVKTFEKEGVGSVRAVMRDGEPYVCARDVARACGYGKATSAVRDRCAEPPTYMPIGLGTGNNSARVIGESDVFRLCAGGTFHSEERTRAGEWLFGDVFPSMRRLSAEGDAEPCGEVPEAAEDRDGGPVPSAAEFGRSLPASVLERMRKEAYRAGQNVRANALSDALAVIGGE